MNHLKSTLAILIFLAPALAQADTQTDAPMRPDDEEGTLMPSDGLAECAAILAITSTHSRNRIEREALANRSADWFAASGDLALQEGALPATDLWASKVENWADRIGSLDALTQKGDWMTYCAAAGQQRGLVVRTFSKFAQ